MSLPSVVPMPLFLSGRFVNPELELGDLKYSIDGSEFENHPTIPTVVEGHALVVLTVEQRAAVNWVLFKLEDSDGNEWKAVTAVVDNTARQVWTHPNRRLTQALQDLAQELAMAAISIRRGDSITLEFTGLGNLENADNIWFTVKDRFGDPVDTLAQLQVSLVDGLLHLNGSSEVTAEDGTIVVDDPISGDLSITLEPSSSALLVPGSGYEYDLQVVRTTGAINTLEAGNVTIQRDITRT